MDSLRKIIRELQKENRNLKDQLTSAGIAFSELNHFSDDIEESEEYDPDQGARIIRPYINKNRARDFYSMFWGRMDVYAKRGRKGGYFPQCVNRWKNYVCPKQHGEKQFCDECDFCQWESLSPQIIMNHLIGCREDGTDAIGVYPLFPDGTCRFLVFDFDNHIKGAESTDYANDDDEWHEEVDAFLYIARPRQEAGIKITVITTDPDNVLDNSPAYYTEIIGKLTDGGVNVISRDEVQEHFAVIDDEIVWRGGVNLLGYDDIWDNLIRIKAPIVASELLELTLGDDKWETWEYNNNDIYQGS